MKTIIAGGREHTDASLVADAIKQSGFTITEVVSGGAKGVDTLGEEWACDNDIPVRQFIAEWQNFELSGAKVKTRYNSYSKKDENYVYNAGFIRNQEMAEYAEALIAIPGEGNGTLDIIKRAKEAGLQVFIYTATI